MGESQFRWSSLDTRVLMDELLVALHECESGTGQHIDALKQQFQWGSWEDVDFTICGVHVHQDIGTTGGVRFAWIGMIMFMRSSLY